MNKKNSKCKQNKNLYKKKNYLPLIRKEIDLKKLIIKN